MEANKVRSYFTFREDVYSIIKNESRNKDITIGDFLEEKINEFLKKSDTEIISAPLCESDAPMIKRGMCFSKEMLDLLSEKSNSTKMSMRVIIDKAVQPFYESYKNNI